MPSYLFAWIVTTASQEDADRWFSDCTDAVSLVPTQDGLTGCNVVAEMMVKASDGTL